MLLAFFPLHLERSSKWQSSSFRLRFHHALSENRPFSFSKICPPLKFTYYSQKSFSLIKVEWNRLCKVATSTFLIHCSQLLDEPYRTTRSLACFIPQQRPGLNNNRLFLMMYCREAHLWKNTNSECYNGYQMILIVHF